MLQDMVMANSMMSLIILMLILTSGFSIVKSAIPPWWIWIYWISPFSWAFRAAALNEFMSEDPAWRADSGVYNNACGGNCTVGEQVRSCRPSPVAHCVCGSFQHGMLLLHHAL